MTVDVEYVLKNGDPRLTNWFLMEYAMTPVIISGIYVTFVTIIGPKWMENKQPYELKKYMILYNILVVCLNLWLFLRFALYGWFNDYNWYCEPIDFSNKSSAVAVLTTCYLFYLTKYVDLLDTVFFLLRKKQSQITFLHVFHHSIVPVVSWYATKYGCGGYTILFPMLNSFVHIWMYLYYALAALGPKVQKYLWWKKHVTKLQLLQFTIMIVYLTRILITKPKNCNPSDFMVYLLLSQAITFFCLFMKFYMSSYLKKNS